MRGTAQPVGNQPAADTATFQGMDMAINNAIKPEGPRTITPARAPHLLAVPDGSTARVRSSAHRLATGLVS